MKIAVFGGVQQTDETISSVAIQLGKLLAEHGCTIITGACPGVSYLAAKSARTHGAEVIGFSPALHREQHIKVGDPYDAFTSIEYIPQGLEFKHNRTACYKFRNIRSALACDAAVIISGQTGTLNEFTLAYDFGKIIGILVGTGGVADIMPSLLEHITKNDKNSQVIIENNVNSLVGKIISCLGQKR